MSRSHGYHSDSDSVITSSMSDSDRWKSSSTLFLDDNDLPDYSFDAATNDMTWDETPSSPKSPLARPLSQSWINRNYHIYCYPKINRSDVCDEVVQRRDPYGSPIRERRVSPLRVKTHQIFDDDTSTDAHPSSSASLSSFYKFEPNNSPESMDYTEDFNYNEDFSTFGPHLASTPSIETAPTRSAKRRLSFSNKENETQEKRRRDNSDAGDAAVNQAIIIREFCVFCKANNESPIIYNFHTLTDKKGRTLCPVLRQIECPICNADGDNAHTTENCPQLNRQQDLQPHGQRNSRGRERREGRARAREYEWDKMWHWQSLKRAAPEQSPEEMRNEQRKLTLLDF